jgi:protocatechuate 3,4-dioxygenase beta subunit
MMTRLQFLGLALLGTVSAGCVRAGSASPAHSLPSTIRIASADEPGERLIVTGRMFGLDGKPQAGVEIYAYQTDAGGRYRHDKLMVDFKKVVPRISGRVASAADGSYTFETIKPGTYPSRDAPAHIHFRLRAEGVPDNYTAVQFEGDPLLRADELAKSRREGTFGEVQPLTRDAAGTLHCRLDFRLTEKPRS